MYSPIATAAGFVNKVMLDGITADQQLETFLGEAGTDVMNFLAFSPKKSAKKCCIRLKTKLYYAKKIDHNIGF
jgi:hypothetical protein